MIKFEKVSRFADADFNLPVRKTANSAGYDFEVAEDIVVPCIWNLTNIPVNSSGPMFLSDVAHWTKASGAKPTLVSSGVKCIMEPNQYLELMVRSSTPLKYWLLLANAPGIVDADYANNPDNEGEIFFQLINFSPFDIQLKKGDIICQGIIKTYDKIDDDTSTAARDGGFGSTGGANA
jgi:dUTP pyrophosphatase